MKRIYPILSIVVAIFIWSCNKTTDMTNVAGDGIPAYLIEVRDNGFFPDIDTIPLGATIKFSNNTTSSHTLISPDSTSILTPTMTPGSAYNFKILKTGTYNYHCIEHPDFSGKIVIRF